MNTGETPVFGLIVNVFVALLPAFALKMIGYVSEEYVLSSRIKVTGPVIDLLFRSVAAALSVV